MSSASSDALASALKNKITKQKYNNVYIQGLAFQKIYGHQLIYLLLGSAERNIEILRSTKLTLFPSGGVVSSSVLKSILIEKV